MPGRVDEPANVSAFPPVMRAKRTQGRGAVRKNLEMASPERGGAQLLHCVESLIGAILLRGGRIEFSLESPRNPA
jgi:hypothetical protein